MFALECACDIFNEFCIVEFSFNHFCDFSASSQQFKYCHGNAHAGHIRSTSLWSQCASGRTGTRCCCCTGAGEAETGCQEQEKVCSESELKQLNLQELLGVSTPMSEKERTSPDSNK